MSTELDYSYCRMNEINEQLFIDDNFVHLIRIDLSFNTITFIADNTFRNNAMLKVLILSYNFLTNIHNCLCPLINLETLRLNNNMLHSIFEIAFATNTKLLSLELQMNSLHILKPFLFRNLVNLEYLNLSQNGLSKLYLDDLIFLNTLDVSCNRFEYISDIILKSDSLKRFNLDWNPLLTITNNCFRELDNLKELHICNQLFITFENEIFNENTRLKKLYLSNVQIDFKIYQNLSNLTHLNLNHSNVNDYYFRSAFQNLTNLQQLCLDNNLITKLDSGGVFKNNTHLSSLSLAQNRNLHIFSIDFFRELPKLRYLNIEQCHPMTQLDFNVFVFNTKLKQLRISYVHKIVNDLPVSVKKFHYNGEKMAPHIPTFITSNANLRLVKLVVDNLFNSFITVHDFYHLNSLVSLELCYNNINNLHSMIFADLNLLKILKLDHNYLKSLSMPIFGPQNCLETLSLGFCKIEMISCEFFKNLVHLEYLCLSVNRLRRLDERIFEQLTQLKMLDLDYCDFEEFHVNTFRFNLLLREVHLEHNLSLNLMPAECFDDLPNLELVSLSYDMTLPENQQNLNYKVIIV